MSYNAAFFKLPFEERMKIYQANRKAEEKTQTESPFVVATSKERMAIYAEREMAALNLREKKARAEAERRDALGPIGKHLEDAQKQLANGYFAPGEKAQLQRKIAMLERKHSEYLAEQKAKADEAALIKEITSDESWQIANRHADAFLKTVEEPEAAEAHEAARKLQAFGSAADYWETIRGLEQRAWDRADELANQKAADLKGAEANKQRIGERLATFKTPEERAQESEPAA